MGWRGATAKEGSRSRSARRSQATRGARKKRSPTPTARQSNVAASNEVNSTSAFGPGRSKVIQHSAATITNTSTASRSSTARIRPNFTRWPSGGRWTGGVLRLMLSGERFTGKRAHELGLLDDIAPSIDIDRSIETRLRELLQAGPEAQGKVKEVLRFNADNPVSEVLRQLPDKLAEVRSGDEAKEGFDAFFEKRKPSWIPNFDKLTGRGV